jgi:acetyl-CoA C-acetyltransferase
MNMGMTAENVAEQFKISRNEQDQMAVDSNKKAAAA